MSNKNTHILKFGGSSLKTPALIRQSAQIVKERMSIAQPVIIVSAIGGVTDKLLDLADHFDQDSERTAKKIEQLQKIHEQLFDELVAPDSKQQAELLELFDELRATVSNQLLREQEHRAWKDRILSIGERASALIFANVLAEQGLPAQHYEATNFIKTDSTFGQANVNYELTRKMIRDQVKVHEKIPVITGFIGSNDHHQITTLGRSGSDFSASLIANALDADHLEIWTDVNGVLTADPRWVPTAESIEQLSFADISELSAHGAKVIHPQTIHPIRHKDTSVLVKNSYNPVHPGTRITSGYHSNGSLKTITVTGPFVQLQVDDEHTYDLLISLKQWNDGTPDSETIGFDRTSSFEPTRFLLKKSFFEKISDKLAVWSNDNNVVLDLQSNLYKVKKFSNHFSKSEKLSKQIWDLLVKNDLRPVSSERNRDARFISFLFEEEDARLAARLLNDYLKGNQTVIDLFVAGTGAVGQTLLEQLKEVEPQDIEFRLVGACNSRKALWSDHGLKLHADLNWTEAEKTDWEQLTKQLTQRHRHNLIFVDATGSEEVARLYPKLFENNIHIVTPSKLANTFEQSFFDDLQTLIKENQTSFRYETTVGAGLPVISTIKDLQSSGDQIHEISGVVSGTMTYLFNQLEQGVPFSKAIADARKKGYAEPDPRDDLSGEDVARKFLTLARTLGHKVEREELEVESLIPEEIKEASKETFMEQLPEYDSSWQQHIQTARDRNEVLRYTGQLKDGQITIGIQSVPKDSPIGQLKGTDNLIQIYSDYYAETPLVIQGPGAGKKVTAAGVLSDILKTAKSLV